MSKTLYRSILGLAFFGFGIGCFGFVIPVSASIHYTRTPAGLSVTSPVTITVTVDDYDLDVSPVSNTWRLIGEGGDPTYPDRFGSCYPKTTLSITETFNYDIGNNTVGVLIDHAIGDDCETQTQNSIYTEGDGSEIIYTIISASAASQQSSWGGVTSYRPEVIVSAPQKDAVFSSQMLIEYQATDKNDEGGGDEKERLGFGPTPVSIFYSDKIFEWEHRLIEADDKILITKDLPAAGSYLWEIPADFAEGTFFRIIVDAVDAIGDVGENISEFFGIDRTAPVFTVRADPPVSKGADVKISLESSEELVEPPTISVTQRSYKKVDVLPIQGEGKVFGGVYQVVPGFDGPAVITVSGKDKAGNIGTVITDGKTFSVGIEPPPKPIIDFPIQEKFTTQESIIFVKGWVREDTEAILVLNGGKEFKSKPDQDGNFIFENITLDPQFHQGENIISVISRDVADSESQAATVTVKLNFGPEISILAPEKDAILNATSTIQIEASDKNNDALLFSYEIKQAQGSKWTTILRSSPAKRYVWDTRGFPDGQYLLRVTADDGFAIIQTTSSPFKVKNFLPIISFLEGELTITNKNSVTIGGSVSSPERPGGRRLKLESFDYSLDQGKQWKTVAAEDGKFDSADEAFSALLSDLTEGEYSLIFRAKDSRGFYGKATKTIIVDFGPPPAPSISSPKPLTVLSDRDDEDSQKAGIQFIISGRAEPKSEVSAALDDTTLKASADDSGAFVIYGITLKNHKQNNIIVFATDRAGNKSSEASLSVIYNNPPAIKFINPRQNRGLSGKSTVQWETKDPDGDAITDIILSYKKGNQPFVEIAKSLLKDSFVWDVGKFEEGDGYQLRLEATDGITPASLAIDIFIDNTPPEIAPQPLGQTAFKESFSLVSAGTASDNLSGIEFIEYSIDAVRSKTSEMSADLLSANRTSNGVDGEEWFKAIITDGYLERMASFKIKHPFKLKDGEYDFGIRAVDAAGNVSKPKFEKIIIDTTPPRIGSYTVSHGPLIFLPEAGSFRVVSGSRLKFAISLESDTKEAFLTIGNQKIDLAKNKATGLWETEVVFEQTGELPMLVGAVDELGNNAPTRQIGSFSAANAGKIYFINQDGVSQAVEEAEINVLVWRDESQSFVRWQAENYGEENPSASLADGRYELVLPPGKYQLLIQKSGFQRLRTSDFTFLEPRFVNFDFILTKRESLRGFFEDVLEKISP